MKASRLISVLNGLMSQPWAVFIWGAPGIGKSSIVRQIAEAKNLPVVDLRASLLDPTDLRGIPMIRNETSVWCPPAFLPKASDKPGILFLDEINAAPPLVQAALYQLILDRRVGEYVLPDGWKIIAAGNRREDKAVTFRLSSALANRFIHLTLDVDADDWHDWAIGHGIDPRVTAFLRARPENLSRTPDGVNPAFATPRSWEMASDVLGQFQSPEAASDILPGILGEGVSTEFLTFVKNSVILRELQSLLTRPDKAPVPKELDRLWVLVSYLTSRAADESVQKAAAVLINRLPADFAVVVAKDIIKCAPLFARNPAFLDFVRAHKECFL